jgi:hypothetical protein
MKMLLPVLAILYLLATCPLGAKILILDANRIVKDRQTDVPRELSTRKSLPVPAYQSETFAKWESWLSSDGVSTFGPLVLGLLLLAVPLPFTRVRTGARDERRTDVDSSLRRIGQSWDPRF